jgi:hypothetical protein
MVESVLEEKLASGLTARGGPSPFVREHVFHRPRKWAFDFAFLEAKLAVECEGSGRGGGRHRSYTGFAADCEKYNQAVLDGWRILRFTHKMIDSGYAIYCIEEALSWEHLTDEVPSAGVLKVRRKQCRTLTKRKSKPIGSRIVRLIRQR